MTTTPQELSPGFRLSDYDYVLPEGLIARYPLDRRDQSRMLVLDRQTGAVGHRHFYDLPDLLNPGDLVVMNNTQVLPARLVGNRQGYTGKVEILLLYPTAEDANCWTAMLKPSAKLTPGTIVEFPGIASTAEVLPLNDQGGKQVRFHLSDQPSVAALMEAVGQMPIPHYLKREAEAKDKETYQTVFAKVPGAQAAPTAGLHFTPEILQALKDKDIRTAEVTLAVSAGTFRSVRDEDITLHQMDPEHYTLPEETARLITETKANGGRVIAIGTTTAKTLETVAKKFQGEIKPDADWSRLFIYPGFEFQIVDSLLTNFHLPKTTLMMLVSAFAGREKILATYEEAVRQEYRFFSYGDCMLIC